MKRKQKKTKHTCNEGDLVWFKEKIYEVAEIIFVGRNGKRPVKSDISVHRIMDNGQVLRRSTVYVGPDWEHVNK